MSPNVLGQGSLPLQHLDEAAFDEMNLVEIPFSTPELGPSGRQRASLSPDGRCYLLTSGTSLPTSLAQRVILGLLWLTKEQNNFTSPVVEFKLRLLVQRFMYPNRDYRANARTLQAVYDELYRIKLTNLVHDRWYSRKSDSHIKVTASIFDQLIENQPKLGLSGLFQIRWGSFVYDSVVAQYTKPLNIRTWLSINKPLDQTLYRWLDRQLERKEVQTVTSCLQFARFKLLMDSRRLAQGGRTGSSYAVKHISDALQRLNGLGLSVQMTIDRSTADFRLTFQRISGSTNQVVEVSTPPKTSPASNVDAVAATERSGIETLVYRFRILFQGAPFEARLAISRGDREAAKAILSRLGLEKSLSLVDQAWQLHRSGPRPNEFIHYFVGILPYLAQAEAQFYKPENPQVPVVPSAEWQNLWRAYCAVLEKNFGGEQDALEAQAAQNVEASLSRLGIHSKDSSTYQRVMAGERQRLCLEKLAAMPIDEFLNFSSIDQLRTALVQRHGFDPLDEGEGTT